MNNENQPVVLSSILIIGLPDASGPIAKSLGADFVVDIHEAPSLIKEAKHSVYVLHLPCSDEREFNHLFKNLRKQNHSFEIVLWGNKINFDLIEGLRIFKIENNMTSYESTIGHALERVQNIKQNQQLLKLIHEQNAKLVALGNSLEERIAKRQNYLQKTHSTIMATNQRGEAFQRALIAVHRSNNVGEMERLLKDAIFEAFKVTWVRIVLGQNMHLTEQIRRDRLSFVIYSVDLALPGEPLGTVYFGRKSENYSRAEKDLLTQISDSISLAIGRLKILSDTEEIKMQWEATFNSITSPLALVDSNYNVIRSNGAFVRTQGRTKCFEILMNRIAPCENCELGKKFRIDLSGELGKVTVLDVTSQKIHDQNIFVNVYRDVSSQLQIETRLMESAKVAELGTIGSSIAHELNNPLGGIITFIHLIKMELKGHESYYADILALEDAAQKCKEIIQNLLNFSRAPGENEGTEKEEELDLNSVVKRAIQIVELQTRSSEVIISGEFARETLPISSNFGMLTQSLITYIQLAIESARAKESRLIRLLIRTKKTKSKISVSIISQDLTAKVSVNLHGPEILRRTIAERILADLGATVEYFAEMEGQVAVNIAFAVPNFPSEV